MTFSVRFSQVGHKALLKKKTELEKELNTINYEIAYNEDLMKKMINSLEE